MTFAAVIIGNNGKLFLQDGESGICESLCDLTVPCLANEVDEHKEDADADGPTFDPEKCGTKDETARDRELEPIVRRRRSTGSSWNTRFNCDDVSEKGWQLECGRRRCEQKDGPNGKDRARRCPRGGPELLRSHDCSMKVKLEKHKEEEVEEIDGDEGR